MRPEIEVWENEGGATRPNREFAAWKSIDLTIYDQHGRAFSFKALASDLDSAVRSAAAWFQRREGLSPKPNRDTAGSG
jgi:hypothetical protein